MDRTGLNQVDSIPVSMLLDRYKIGKTAIYDRLKALCIQPDKRGRVSYVSAFQLDQLDQLNLRLKAGESMPSPNVTAEQTELIEPKNFKPLTLVQNVTAERTELNTIALSPSTESLILALSTMLKPDRDLLQNHSQLQRCSDNGWLLPTIQLRQIVGKVPKRDWFQQMGFTFHKSDREWKVTKNAG